MDTPPPPIDPAAAEVREESRSSDPKDEFTRRILAESELLSDFTKHITSTQAGLPNLPAPDVVLGRAAELDLAMKRLSQRLDELERDDPEKSVAITVALLAMAGSFGASIITGLFSLLASRRKEPPVIILEGLGGARWQASAREYTEKALQEHLQTKEPWQQIAQRIVLDLHMAVGLAWHRTHGTQLVQNTPNLLGYIRVPPRIVVWVVPEPHNRDWLYRWYHTGQPREL